MTRAPAVSIVMPVYNRAQRVGAAIASLLAQTHEDFELIVVDDGSTDATLQTIETFRARDTRLRLLALPANGGQGLARAIGTDAARGHYVAVMDSDDVALPDRLEKQLAFMQANPAVTLAGANAVKVMGQQRAQMRMPVADGEIKARLLLADCAFVHPTVIMLRDFLRTHNLNYSAERRGDDDYEFYTRLVAAGARFANAPDTVLDYHRHDGNISANSPRLEQDKTPLRRYLLGLYYPDLTGREVAAIANVMQRGIRLGRQDALEGLTAMEKAMAMRHSVFGEDHDALNAILARYRDALGQALGMREHCG